MKKGLLQCVAAIALSSASCLFGACAEVPTKPDEAAVAQEQRPSAEDKSGEKDADASKGNATTTPAGGKSVVEEAPAPSHQKESAPAVGQAASSLDGADGGAEADAASSSSGAETFPDKASEAQGLAADGEAPSTSLGSDSEQVPAEEAVDVLAFDEALKDAMAPDADLESLKNRFQKLATDAPKAAAAHHNLALVLERLGDVKAAEAAYVKCLGLDRNMKAAAQNLAKLHLRGGTADEGERILRDMAKASEPSAAILGALALLDVETGRIEAAIADARAALKIDEMDVATMVTLSRAYAAQNRLELAALVLGNASGIAPDSPLVANQMGVLMLRQDRKQAARDYFKKAAEAQADFPEAHANYGAALMAAQNFAEAAEHLELALKYAPDLTSARVNLASAYRGMGDFQRAKELYQKAREDAPELAADIEFNLGILYLDGQNTGLAMLDQLTQAEEHLNASEALRHDDLIAEYLKVAKKRVDKEKRRLAREEKKRQKEEEARKSQANGPDEGHEGEASQEGASPAPGASEASGDPTDAGPGAPSEIQEGLN